MPSEFAVVCSGFTKFPMVYHRESAYLFLKTSHCKALPPLQSAVIIDL